MKPLVSVVIPCRNEVTDIAATVQAILDSKYPNLEVLVVDGMSDDGTRRVLTQMSDQEPRLRMIDNPHKLTPFAFNLGVLHARGDFVQIVGSRNLISHDYISILMRTLDQRPDVACVGGDYQHVYDNEQSRAIALAMESKFGVGGGNYRTMQRDAYVDTVGIPLYRRAIFTEVGIFDERLTRNQDDEFNYRVRAAGFKIFYVHEAKATYKVRGSFVKAFQQFFQYGYFKVFVSRKHGVVTTYRQIVPALFVAFYAVGLVLAPFSEKVRGLLLLVGFFYLVFGMMMAGKSLNPLDRLKVLSACLVLHLGYGLGYWQGILDFFILRRIPRERISEADHLNIRLACQKQIGPNKIDTTIR